ncbi:MAG TPA: GNAT family N-acetyltransferase [Nocardioides sp.]|nr:GNAT family N-acetyltransferase [Nocardioides sp.]
MRSVGVEELEHLPFVRHQVDPDLVEGAWCRGDAAVVLAGRPVAGGTMRVLTGFGPEGELADLLGAVAERVTPPERLTVTAPADLVPTTWALSEVRRWHWMLTRTPVVDPTPEVEDVADPDDVAALIDAAAPGSHARPGQPGIEAWLGIREEGRLVAVGAVVRQPDGTGHVRAVTVAEQVRGRGLGRRLSAALTRRAMAGTGVCTLGVYVDNEPALRIYRGLGYEVVHTFTSGAVTERSITTAAVPSR